MILPTCWEAELANKHPRRCCLHESLDSWTHLQPVYLALRRILHQRVVMQATLTPISLVAGVVSVE